MERSDIRDRHRHLGTAPGCRCAPSGYARHAAGQHTSGARSPPLL